MQQDHRRIVKPLDCSKLNAMHVLRRISQCYSMQLWNRINRLTIIKDLVALTLTKAGGYDALGEIRMTSAPSSKYILPGAILLNIRVWFKITEFRI